MADLTLSIPDNILGVPSSDPIQPPPVVEDAVIEDTSVVQDAAQEQQGGGMTLEDDWRMGLPFVMEENKTRYATENAKPEAVTPVAPVKPTYKTVNVGHGSFKIDSRATPEVVQKAISNYVQEDIDFYKGMDRTTGAPWNVVKAVGDSLKPEDKLATIRSYFKDAMRFGEDNFIYTNPDTGKVTMFNSPGFQTKDIAEYSRDISIAVGSTLAGIAGYGGGLVIGAPVGPGALLTGTLASAQAAAWGGAATASFYDWISQLTGETVRTESLLARVGENVIQGIYAGAGEGIGRVVVPYVLGKAAKGFGGGTQKGKMIYETLIKNNIKPTAGAVTGGRGAGRIEKALDQAAASATRMQNSINEAIDGARKAAETLAARIGTARTQQGTGILIQKAAKNALERFSQQQTKLETELGEKIGEGSLFTIDSMRGFYDELKGLAKTMPRFSETAYGSVTKILDDIMFDAAQNGGRIPYSSFRQIRGHFGKKMADMTEGVNRSMYKRIYASMTDDLKFGADSLGYGKMFDDAVAFTRGFKQEYNDFLNKVIDYDAPEKGFRFLMNSKNDGGTYFQKLQDQFTPKEWSDVSATLIQKMGYKNFGNEADEAFSVATFLSNWGKIADEAKATLFKGMKNGKELQKDLDGLLDGFEAMAANTRLAGHSNSAAVSHTLNVMNSLGGNFTKAILGASAITSYANVGVGVAGVAAAIGGGVVTPNVAARLITNARFVRWLAQAPEAKTGQHVGAHIGRLFGIREAEPEIAAEIDEYISVLQSGTMPNEGTEQ